MQDYALQSKMLVELYARVIGCDVTDAYDKSLWPVNTLWSNDAFEELLWSINILRSNNAYDK